MSDVPDTEIVGHRAETVDIAVTAEADTDTASIIGCLGIIACFRTLLVSG